MKRSEYISELLSDLHPDSFDEVENYISNLRSLLKSHVNYLLFMNGENDIEQHPQEFLIRNSLELLEDDNDGN
jgi:hypothetical protein